VSRGWESTILVLLDARLQEIVAQLGGFDAILTGLGDNCADDRWLPELIRDYDQSQDRHFA
jgi:hypothetical protein